MLLDQPFGFKLSFLNAVNIYQLHEKVKRTMTLHCNTLLEYLDYDLLNLLYVLQL